MTSAASFIEALNARHARTGRLREPARVSWRAWMERLAQQPGRVTGAPAEDLVAQLAARPAAARARRVEALNRWQAFGAIWRQQWHPASSDERRWRWTAGGTSFGWHVLLVAFLLWVTALHMFPPKPAADDAVVVEFIGVGTPLETGGGEAPAAATASGSTNSQPDAASTAASGATPARPPADPVARAEPAAASASSAEPAATPTPAAVVATPSPQPLATTRPVNPEPPVFEVPPTQIEPVNPLAEQAPQVQRKLLAVPAPPKVPPVQQPATDMQVQPTAAPAPVAVRGENPAPVRAPLLREPAPPAVTVVKPAPAPVPTRVAAVPLAVTPAPVPSPKPTPAPVPSTTPTSTPAQATPSASNTTPATPTSAAAPSAASAASAAKGPARSTTAGVGTGPKPTPTAGASPSPTRSDEWGASKRNVSGTRAGQLYDGNGLPRLGPPAGSASAGLPPGSITQEIHDFDRSGTWLKRKPYPYEPTRFDRFWRPNETLLEEWVRRGVKKVSIPIPGTTKHLECGVSLLQLGGGCWVVDANLNEQPPTARPPPDVPFKPGLQQGNGATPPRPGGTPARDPKDPFPIPIPPLGG